MLEHTTMSLAAIPNAHHVRAEAIVQLKQLPAHPAILANTLMTQRCLVKIAASAIIAQVRDPQNVLPVLETHSQIPLEAVCVAVVPHYVQAALITRPAHRAIEVHIISVPTMDPVNATVLVLAGIIQTIEPGRATVI